MTTDDIAVVGIAYRLPGDVEDDVAFWQVLEGAKNLSGEWPASRMTAAAHPDHKNGSSHSIGGHFISQDPAGFDAPLFGITAKEAASMDPVQRWTLEVSYRAFENAGIPFETLNGSRTAVLSATFTEDYIRMAAMDPDNVERTAATGCLASVIPNRVSYFFGMRGPSMHVDTACSSGLSAFDVAHKMLRSGDADAALVTAANLVLEPGMFQMFRNLQMLSPDSTCKAFDHRANGFGRGEGVLGFVLKPVAAALRDGDVVRAVVRGVASNQDGHTPILSQPNPAAQEDLIRHVYRQAGLGLANTGYVEAHGTGTPVGDPIEMKAIGNAFRAARPADRPLYVGSIKSNIGHLEGASGLAGILKAIFILERGVIPPNALFEKLNPDIDAEHLRVKVPHRCIPWPSAGLRRVSVNGFGFGGSNTHVILDDALHYLEERGLAGSHCTRGETKPAPIENGASADPHAIAYDSDDSAVVITTASNGTEDCVVVASPYPKLLVFSALDEKTAKRTVDSYAAWFRTHQLASDPARLDALAYTLAARRSHMRWRSFATATAADDGKEVSLSPAKPVRVVSDPAVGWVFTGQGVQYVDMGCELAALYAVFEQTLRQVDGIYQSLGCPWSVFDQLHCEDIDAPEYSQPLSTAVQLGLVELLKSWGICPKVVVGHSSGEIAAAYASGSITLVSACKISYFRGLVAGKLRAASTSNPGSMVSVNVAADQVPGFLERAHGSDGVGIACVNSPFNVTLSGPEAGVDAAKAQADREGIFARKLKTGVAYHSAAMAQVADEYLELMGRLESGASVVPMVSAVTGKAVGPEVLASGQYWVDNLVSPVEFVAAVRAATGSNITDVVEIGPHPALRRYVQDTLGRDQTRYASTLQRGHSDAQGLLDLAGSLFCRGHAVSLAAINGNTQKVLADLPGYPFDHSHRFWAESRISKDYRLRAATRADVLGQRVADWNPLQPRWRSFLSVETHPWIGHHVVGGSTLYPAAGMLVMALEAAREATANKPSGFVVRDAHFSSPVVVPEHWDDRVETMLSVNPVATGLDVRICAFNKDRHSWTEVFRASVQPRFGDDHGEAGRQQIRERHQQAAESCALPVDSHLLYSDAAEQGLQYGEWFRLCHDIRWDREAARAVASVPTGRLETTSLVHPAVLDTAFHVLRVGAGQQRAANVPVRLGEAWFAESGWKESSVHWLASSSAVSSGEKGSVSALSDDGTVLATIGRLETATVSREKASDKKLLHAVEWKPQLGLLSPQQLAQACLADTFSRDEATMLAEHRQRTAVLNAVAVRHCLAVPPERRAAFGSTLRHHMDWMEHHVKTLPAEEREAAAAMDSNQFEARLDAFAAAFPSWSLYPHVARSLPAILAGDLDPLQVIFESDHAKTFYASLFHTVCGDGRLGRLVDLAAHEKPALRILEVGAGTGGMTVHILDALRAREKRTGGMAFSEYAYTDISPVFFESAKARWDATDGVGARMNFQTLDMEKSVAAQGFDEGSYDLLVAGSCVHATERLDKTLQNLRRLLRPGGRLVMLEVTDPRDIATCFFATLAGGWWLSQEAWRQENKSPLASEDAWDGVLRENGFSGNDVVLRDTREEEAHIVSVIVSTAVEEKHNPVQRRAFVVNNDSQEQLARVLASDNDTVVPLDQVDGLSDGLSVVVSLVEVGQPLLSRLTEAQFAQLQTLVKLARNLVWVAAADNDDTPLYAVAQGMLRTVRAEMPDSHVVSLTIEDTASPETQAEYVNTAIEAASTSTDLEFVVRDGLMHTARAVENVPANGALDALLAPRLQQLAWKDGPAVKLAMETPGSLESLRFEQDASETELGCHEVEIEAHAWVVSRREMLAPGLSDFGTECAGIVTRVGPNCDSLQSGDAVVMLAKGCLRRFPRADASRVFKTGPNTPMPLDAAVAAVGPAVTAHHIFDIARLERGDRLLVHDAASAVGQMVVRLAQSIGAEVFATTTATQGSDEEAREKKVVLSLGVSPHNLFWAGDGTTAFAQGIRRATAGEGVDVVVNTLASDQLRASWELLAPCGRLVDLGDDNASLLPAKKNASYASVDLADLQPRTMGRLLAKTAALLDQSVTAPSGMRVFAAAEIKEAFRALQSGGGMVDRVVIRAPASDDVVPQLVLDRKTRKACALDPNASYLVPGGLGGVGRSVLAWMAGRGAKHLIVPSRSGVSSPAAAKLVAKLSSAGVHVATPKCDIGSEADLAALLESCRQSMPPVRGVVNCAMVLTNAVFANMTYEQWSSAIRAKVDASFNLHRLLLPEKPDFLVHLASLAGVNGQMASANYAAGCSFQDALARRAPGATALDVGWMADVGLIAETAAFQRQLHDWGNMQRVTESELLAVLDMVCGGEKENQILVGLRTPADYLAKGKEPPASVLDRPLLSAFAQPVNRNGGTSNDKTENAAADHGALFKAAPDDKTKAGVVAAAMAEKLGRAMMMSGDDIDVDKPLSAYGIDSLMAVELKNWIGRQFGVKLGMWEMMNGDKVIRGIAETVVKKGKKGV